MSNEFSNANDIKNRPLYNQKNRPLALVAHIDSRRNYVSAGQIEELAGKNGNVITSQDLMDAGLVSHKKQAQKTLKYHLAKGTLFTLRNTRPQQYYPSSKRSEVIEKDLQKNGPIDPIGVAVPNQRHISKNPLANCLEPIISQTLEGYILPLLPTAPLFIHNMHLKTRVSPERYAELNLPHYKRNYGKHVTEIMGKTRVDYVFYANGTVDICTECSRHPFRLQTEEDRSRLLVFFGQLRGNLVNFLKDPHERLVPDIMEWQLTECDINKDIKVSDFLHVIGIKIQPKYADHLFRVYIKSKGADTVCRVEEQKMKLGKDTSPIETINTIFNPTEELERRLIHIEKKIDALMLEGRGRRIVKPFTAIEAISYGGAILEHGNGTGKGGGGVN